MAVAAGPEVADEVERLAERLTEVASTLYDLDQSSSLAVFDVDADYAGRTREVLADLDADRGWLWPAYAAVRERVDHAREHLEARQWEAARERLVEPISIEGVPVHGDAVELVDRIDETARAVLDVAVSVAPLIGENLGHLTRARSELGALEEHAALLGISRHHAVLAARAAVDRGFAQVTRDPLGTDPRTALDAVAMARAVVEDADARLQALPDQLDAADVAIYEIEVLIQRGREALDRARDKVLAPKGLLVPMSTDVISTGTRGLRPWWERLVKAVGEGDHRAAITGMESWMRLADAVRQEAERIVEANEAPVRRRDELRGLLGALWAKAAAAGLAEDPEASRLHEAAREVLYVAPCSLEEAERRVDVFRRHLANR